MHRGKALQPDRDCDYCGSLLPALRHPSTKYCNPTCRQRDRYQIEHDRPGIKCLDCGKLFIRVGSHVVQVHGYGSTAEYLQEHGLMAKETHTQEHIEDMRGKVTYKAMENLQLGKPNRYRKGGDHGEKLKKFWKNRKDKKGYEVNGTTIDNRRTIRVQPTEDRG
jgi:hypothetical protein